MQHLHYLVAWLFVASVASSAPASPCASVTGTLNIEVGQDWTLFVDPPEGWCVTRSGSRVALLSAYPAFASAIEFDWYRPYRERDFRDFAKRMEEELRSRREFYDVTGTHEGALGELRTFEITFRSNADRVWVEVYVAIPGVGGRGELFVISFTGPAQEQETAYMEAFREMLASAKLAHRES